MTWLGQISVFRCPSHANAGWKIKGINETLCFVGGVSAGCKEDNYLEIKSLKVTMFPMFLIYFFHQRFDVYGRVWQ